MEDLFGILITLFCLFIGFSSKKKKKKADQKTDAEATRRPAEKKPTTEIKANFAEAFAQLTDALEEEEPILAAAAEKLDKVAAKAVESARTLRPAVVQAREAVRPHLAPEKAVTQPAAPVMQPEPMLAAFGLTPRLTKDGENASDAEGCIGGSLGQHAHEGEGRAEHAGHLIEAEARRRAAVAAMTEAQSRRAAAREEMRRAVVWSEILDKPVALRRR